MSASTNYDVIPRVSYSQQQTGVGAFLHVVQGHGEDATGATTKYLAAAGGNHASAQVKLFLATHACTIQNLYASAQTAPGGTDTAAVTVQSSTDQGANWTDTTLTCTITGTATNASDTANRVAVAAGTMLAIKVVSSGATAAKIHAAFEAA